MNSLLISGFGTSISVDKRKLSIANRLENTLLEFYPHQIPYDSIIIDGHSGNITFDAVRWLTKHDVSITMLNWNGQLLATLLPKEPVLGKLKVKQYEKYLDKAERYKIAKAILTEKINKAYELLIGLSNHYTEIDRAEVDKAFSNLKAKYEGSPELLTYEGNIAIFSWSELRKIFNKLYPSFNFTDRNGRRHSWNTNASDEINALLNYAYAIVEAEVRKDITSIGLDTTISFLHELDDGRASLVYDLQELYRWIADLSVLQLLEEKRLRKADFIVTENYHIRLREVTAKALVDKIKLNFNARALYNNRYCSFQNILYENVRLLANYISGKSSTLKFNIPKMEMKREDNIDLRAKLLSITPEERRKLGINKSTLWYAQNNIKAGKKIKVYNKIMEKLK
jgi:CRISPR-associated protein Cas1